MLSATAKYCSLTTKVWQLARPTRNRRWGRRLLCAIMSGNEKTTLVFAKKTTKDQFISEMFADKT